ncbi:response regulator transcription factor [Pseudomonas protegens]|uniref:response regulator n=1 Tax=Pseudomonas protegens TaxID=380021 RepID=UPI000F471A0C|nr:response regulator transcription factor [Pseudomonas protegens]ROL94054.1 hypothetical protein BK639_16180 [Pseudomonas protegens]ROM00224.1 hypothetical protein BK641_26140 [Pseudomonas protegens]ROM03714.1 hypothetical protein BK640_12605 [Pseudomonas protegens]ROM11026.1 hypothetical protein BK642_06155 [Pseudomonas protegens]
MNNKVVASVLIIDDHPIARLGIRTLLQREGVEVITETQDSRDAMQLIRQHVPDLVILDLNLPHANGLNLLEEVQRLPLQIPVIVLSEQPAAHHRAFFLQRGAAAFINKDALLKDLLSAVRQVLNGNSQFSERLLDQ